MEVTYLAYAPMASFCVYLLRSAPETICKLHYCSAHVVPMNSTACVMESIIIKQIKS